MSSNGLSARNNNKYWYACRGLIGKKEVLLSRLGISWSRSLPLTGFGGLTKSKWRNLKSPPWWRFQNSIHRLSSPQTIYFVFDLKEFIRKIRPKKKHLPKSPTKSDKVIFHCPKSLLKIKDDHSFPLLIANESPYWLDWGHVLRTFNKVGNMPNHSKYVK